MPHLLTQTIYSCLILVQVDQTEHEWLPNCLAGLRELEAATANIELSGPLTASDESGHAVFAALGTLPNRSVFRDITITDSNVDYFGRIEVITPQFSFMLDRDAENRLSLRDTMELKYLDQNDHFRLLVRQHMFMNRFISGTWLHVHTFTPLAEVLTSGSCTIESADTEESTGDFRITFSLSDGAKYFDKSGTLNSLPTRSQVDLRPSMNWAITRSIFMVLSDPPAKVDRFVVEPEQIDGGLIVARSCDLELFPFRGADLSQYTDITEQPNRFERFTAEKIRIDHLNEEYFLPARFDIPNHLVGIKAVTPLWMRWWIWLIAFNVGVAAWWVHRRFQENG